MEAFLDSAPNKFLSTPSARRATKDDGLYVPTPEISIHALREEGDSRYSGDRNPVRISIHALREEGDIVATFDGLRMYNFYPRPPRGGRPYLLFL